MVGTEHDLDLRRAMLSVYYHALGRELRLQGAPAVLLPPEVRPLSLADALAALVAYPDHLRNAAWTILRGIPVPLFGDDGGDRHIAARYPAELRTVIEKVAGKIGLEEFDGRRVRYRRGSHLFSAALTSFARGRDGDFDRLAKMFRDEQASERAVGSVGAVFSLDTPVAYLDAVQALAPGSRERERAAEGLRKLQDDVGLSIDEFATQFADAVAFVELWPPPEHGGVSVYPASSITVQNTDTLAITVTVTTLVSSPDVRLIACSIDPRSWTHCTQSFLKADIVANRFTLQKVDAGVALGAGWDDFRLVDEVVEMSWGLESDQVGWFHNVLRVGPFKVDEKARTVELAYSLDRSIESRVLWDQRAGGLLVNQGYIKVRPVVKGLWRVTTRKVLRFSDRTPYTGGSGAYDFGQMLGFLAPAALNWWLETEMYTSSCPDTVAAALGEGDDDG